MIHGESLHRSRLARRPTVVEGGRLDGDFTVVGTGNGLYFYNGSSGAAAVGYFDADGTFYQTPGYGPGSFGTCWSHVVRITK